MTDSFIAYDLQEVRKKRSLSIFRMWHKGDLLSSEQFEVLKESYQSSLFSPSIIMRILLFIAASLGFTTILVPVFIMVSDSGEEAFRVFMGLVGAVLLGFTDQVIIKRKKHYKSGLTEAGYYTGLSFLFISVFDVDAIAPIIFTILGLAVCIFTMIRYLDLLSLISALACFIGLLFLIFESVMSLIPFIIMIVFFGLFLYSQSLQKRADKLIWEDHFILFDSVALLLIYLGGNYFVVRELSIEMLGMNLKPGEDIPFAILFYCLTFLIPLGYLIWGITKRSLLFIRVSLLVLTLSLITIKYYYPGYMEATVTAAGAILILISLALIKYFKHSRNGYVRDQIFKTKWDNADLAAFVASQSLGGHQINEPQNTITGQGGEFGGGGASGDY